MLRPAKPGEVPTEVLAIQVLIRGRFVAWFTTEFRVSTS
jgi:hypothetical protein